MARKQKLVCPDCKITFEFDPEHPGNVVTSTIRFDKSKPKKDEEVKAYLTCPNGHVHPYKVKL